jgi:hypothetical protein
MASELFVFTAAKGKARQHREATIDRLVGIDEIAPRSARAAAGLRAAGLEEVRCWGSVPGPGNQSSWRRMEPGHWALLYGGEKHFPWLLRVGLKTRSKSLARHLWGEDAEGRTWELMFFFDLGLRVDLSLSEVREALAYEEKEWVPQGLQYPAGWRQAALLDRFGSFEAFASESSVSPAAEAAVPPPSLEELLVGGRYKGPLEKPPRAPRRLSPPDPDRTGRGLMAHEETVAKLEKHIGPSFRIGTRGVNHDGTWKRAGTFCICEVKSITAKNEVQQLQKGLGQILHNRFKAQRGRRERVETYLIAEHEPADSSLWRELCEQQGVVFSWPERFDLDVEVS